MPDYVVNLILTLMPYLSVALFVTAIVLTTGEVVLAAYRWRQRRYVSMALMIGCAVVMAATAGSQVWLGGMTCLMPHAAVIDYYPGMRLCPDQAIQFETPHQSNI